MRSESDVRWQRRDRTAVSVDADSLIRCAAAVLAAIEPGFRDWVDSTQSLRTIQIVPRRGLPVQARYQGLGGIHPVRDP